MAVIATAHDLATIIRGRRLRLGLSQEVLAQRIGVARSWLSAVERGKRTVQLDLVIQLLDALDVDLVAQERSSPVDSPNPALPPPIDLDDLLDRHRSP